MSASARSNTRRTKRENGAKQSAGASQRIFKSTLCSRSPNRSCRSDWWDDSPCSSSHTTNHTLQTSVDDDSCGRTKVRYVAKTLGLRRRSCCRCSGRLRGLWRPAGAASHTPDGLVEKSVLPRKRSFWTCRTTIQRFFVFLLVLSRVVGMVARNGKALEIDHHRKDASCQGNEDFSRSDRLRNILYF